MVTANPTQAPNELKVRDVREARILDTPDHDTRERKNESSLFDVLKIIRDTKTKKASLLDDKYKRFSMNNFEEIKSSVDPLIDFVPRDKEEIQCPSENKLDKSKWTQQARSMLHYF